MVQATAGKKPTVLEIAREAKVSRAAVYAVLNATRPTNIVISEKKRQRILEVANTLGYVRNELARSLVTGKTLTIGIEVHSLKTQFYTDFFTFLDDACYRDGYSVFITSSEYDVARELRNLKAFLAKRVDAVVAARTQPYRNDEILRQLIGQGIPVILLGEVDVPGLDYPVVGFDEAKVGELAAKHLWTLGHRKVLYLNAGKTRDDSLRTHQVRHRNFLAAWTRLSGGKSPELFEARDPMHGGTELAEHLGAIPKDELPTAVACSTDRLALSAISALRLYRIGVPGDISMIGCDDIMAAAEAAPPLTTIRLPMAKLAESLWTLLKRKIAPTPEPADSGPDRLIVQPELVGRESTQAINKE